jgi:hypothetical protein
MALHDTKPDSSTRPSGLLRSAALPLVTLLLSVAIFIIDTVTKYEVAAATFYVVVVLLSTRFCRTQGVVTTSAACIALTVASFVLTPGEIFAAASPTP